ncbi:MAG: T9SS type A sorting domain-containing protein [Crocinitomicaceae bacterium]|nr:T9SS type A sorting domain-containing protein [Flavobacteriales bacterium]NQZ34228.1 T9SS type A sorting domain-containing protein [Crocinitomicaceae bacterium]
MKIQLITAVALLLGGIVNAQTITNYTTADGLLADNVNCVDVDANDAVWFGTQNGVSVFDGVTWVSHTTSTDPGLIDNTIQAIFVASSGDVWIGTDFGASVYSATTWTSFTTTDGLGNNQIKCINEDAAGQIWFGTNSGASVYDGASFTNFGTADGLPFGGVNEIDVHSSGDVWMGTGLSGVSVYDGSNFTTINDTDGLIDNRIRAIVFDGSDNKWIGTSEGITVLNASNTFSMNHTTMFSLPAPDTLNPVEDIEMDSQGIIWAGIYIDYLVTEGGVCAYNGNTWNEYKVADGLVGPVVRALAIDGNDDVWVATSTGVSKISDPTVGIVDPELAQLHMYPNPTSGVITLNTQEGAIGSEVMIYDASMKIVHQATVESTNTKLNLNHLTSGIYFVKNGSSIERLIVQ